MIHCVVVKTRANIKALLCPLQTSLRSGSVLPLFSFPDAKMSEAIYIQKPEDAIHLSPDREARDKPQTATQAKNLINEKKHKHPTDMANAENSDSSKVANNNEDDDRGFNDPGGNYYVKEPGSEESLNSGPRGSLSPGFPYESDNNADNRQSGYSENMPLEDAPTSPVRNSGTELVPVHSGYPGGGENVPLVLDTTDQGLDSGPEYANEDAPGFPEFHSSTGGSGSSFPLQPLAMDESFEQNSRRLVEVDDEGNTLKTHPRVPSRYVKSRSPDQNAQTENLLQALARLDLDTIPTDSHDVQPSFDTDPEDYLTPRTHEHIYAEIVDKKVERHVRPTGSVRVVENERRVRVPIIRRLTRTFSINRRHGHGTRNSSSTLYRDRFSKLPKIPQEKKHDVTCSCNKKILLCSVVVLLIVLLLGVVAAVLLTMVLNKDSEPGECGTHWTVFHQHTENKVQRVTSTSGQQCGV